MQLGSRAVKIRQIDHFCECASSLLQRECNRRYGTTLGRKLQEFDYQFFDGMLGHWIYLRCASATNPSAGSTRIMIGLSPNSRNSAQYEGRVLRS